MILSKEDKERFHDGMEYFKELLESDIKKTNIHLELKLVSFGIPIENQNDILYFDFPYMPNVDEINEALLPHNKFDDVDVRMYDLLDSSGSDLKYLAYNYDGDGDKINISDEFHSSLNEHEITSNLIGVVNFFKIMYYSAFPDEWPGVDNVDDQITVLKDGSFQKWFIIIHNEDISDSSSKIISNYCLILNSECIEDFKENDLLSTSNKLKEFSKYYATKDFNVILRKNIEHGDSVLSVNSEIYHHLKELNLNLSLHPILKLKEVYPDNVQIQMVERNLLRVQYFYENYVNFLKSKSILSKKTLNIYEYFNDNNFTQFKNDICSTYGGLSIDIYLPENCLINTNFHFFDIIIKELILNAIKSIEQQKIKIKKVIINIIEIDSKLMVSVTSCDTRYKKNHHLPVDSLGLKLIQSNSKTGECGYGLYLVNKLLSQLSASSRETNLGKSYLNFSNFYGSVGGFTVSFTL